MGLWQQSWGQPQAAWLLCSLRILESRLTSFSTHRLQVLAERRQIDNC